jgi:glycosyltransferase involved in cell wall biosynthesis
VRTPIRLLVLIHSFDTGGAQRQLIALLKGLDRGSFRVTVVSMQPGGGMADEMRAVPGVEWIPLERRPGWGLLPFALQLRAAARALEPDLVYGYMGPARIAVLLLPRKCSRIIWGVRDSNMDLRHYGWMAHAGFRLERMFAGRPDLILANSQAGRDYVVSRGFPPHKTRVVDNGIDTGRFRADPVGRARLRNAWRVPPQSLLVGVVGRLDPMKGHRDFLSAAAMLARRKPGVHFVCVGDGPPGYRAELAALARDLGLERLLTWAGEERDMSAAYSAFDIAVSSSAFGEGFSNVVAEAMACGVPCVVTDVGDSARIVGDAGVVVPAQQPAALAEGILQMVQRCAHGDYADAALRCEVNRARVRENFSVERMVAETQALLSKLARTGGA